MTRKRGRPLSARPAKSEAARLDPETFDKLRTLHERFARMTGPPANAFAVGDIVGLAADLAEKATSPGFTLVENDRLAVAVNAAFNAAVEERGIERTPGLAAAPTDAGDAAITEAAIVSAWIVSAWKVRNAGMESAWPKRNPGAGGCRGRG